MEKLAKQNLTLNEALSMYKENKKRISDLMKENERLNRELEEFGD